MVTKTTFRQFIAPRPGLGKAEGTPRIKCDMSCHFDRREKSFLDPSHSLGMTASACHLANFASLRHGSGHALRESSFFQFPPPKVDWISNISS